MGGIQATQVGPHMDEQIEQVARQITNLLRGAVALRLQQLAQTLPQTLGAQGDRQRLQHWSDQEEGLARTDSVAGLCLEQRVADEEISGLVAQLGNRRAHQAICEILQHDRMQPDEIAARHLH